MGTTGGSWASHLSSPLQAPSPHLQHGVKKPHVVEWPAVPKRQQPAQLEPGAPAPPPLGSPHICTSVLQPLVRVTPWARASRHFLPWNWSPGPVRLSACVCVRACTRVNRARAQPGPLLLPRASPVALTWRSSLPHAPDTGGSGGGCPFPSCAGVCGSETRCGLAHSLGHRDIQGLGRGTGPASMWLWELGLHLDYRSPPL